MNTSINDRLADLGIELAAPPAAVANYVPVMRNGPLLYVSGQIPVSLGAVVYQGCLGRDVDLETGIQAARLCAINVLTQVKAEIGDLERIEQCLRLGGFISSSADFYDHAKVMNGASDLMVDVLGTRGRHARAAIGCSSLPLNSAVEVEALFRVAE